MSLHHGATGRTRTGDLLITNQLLYQLSHSSIFVVLGATSVFIYYKNFFMFRQEVFHFFKSIFSSCSVFARAFILRLPYLMSVPAAPGAERQMRAGVRPVIATGFLFLQIAYELVYCFFQMAQTVVTRPV